MKIIALLIVGVVIDLHTREPLCGVKITSGNEIVYTDFDGRFKTSGDTVKVEYISYADTVACDSVISIRKL
jgi:hypothetical protein